MRSSRHVTPELLAPAGSPEALRAAVANGADAVYLGVDRFNARRSAENFALETLAGACAFAHLRGSRVYLTANIVVLPNEMDEALDLIDAAWVAGVDAVIVQDLGLLRGIRTTLPHVRVHASTQVNAHSSSTVEELASMGAKRVTLSRETSLAEIHTLAGAGRRAGVEVESFVHGALCVCYSGQCLLSSLIGGRSANRGMCAQPCRLTYELIDAVGRVLDVPGAHLLSPKDLAGISVLPELIASGVGSLKIEGRMKSAEYVAIVTGVYRAALDRAAAAPDSYAVRDGEMDVLSEAFSRGFTEAYLSHERGNPMMSYQRPNNRGVLVGRVGSLKGSSALLTLETALSSDDTVEVWTGRGRFAQSVGPLLVEGEVRDNAPAGARVLITLAEPAAVEDRVFRVRNAALLAAATRTFHDAEVAPVEVAVSAKVVIGEPVSVTVSLPGGESATALGSVVAAARTRPVSAEDVIEHVGRFGGSGFTPADWDVAISPGAGVGFSELHRVRRDALDALRDAMLAAWSGRSRVHPTPEPLSAKGGVPLRSVVLVASVGDLETGRRCLDAGADLVHVPAEVLGGELIEGVVPVLPRICHDEEEPSMLARAQAGEPVVASTLGQLRAARQIGAQVETHWSLNVVNAHAVAELAERGASFVWLSPELSAPQVAAVAARAPVPVGVAVAGRQEVMVTEHCVLMAEGECSRACDTCARRAGMHVVRDRKGYEFPVRTDAFGRTHVYNSVPLDLTTSLREVLDTGVSALRADLVTETPDAAAAAVRRVRAALESVRSGGDAPPADRSVSTSGHFYRGVQ